MASPSTASLKTYIPHIIILVTQLLSVCAHIYIATLLIITISAKSTLGVLSPAYITLLLLFTLALTLLIHTFISLLNRTLTPTSYSHLQNLSLSLYLISLLILSILSLIPSFSPNDAGELVTGLLAITAIAGIPFIAGTIFAEIMWRLEKRESKVEDEESKVGGVYEVGDEADEETPLLQGDRARDEIM